MEQFVRDARIAMIYEGANGIQALDLVGRKLPKDGGRAVTAFFKEVGDFVKAHKDDATLAPFIEPLKTGLDDLQTATMWFMANAMTKPDNAGAGATDYMHLFGLVALGHMWARIAIAAKGNDARSEAATSLAGRAFMERTMPETSLRLARITAGADTLMAMPAEGSERGTVLYSAKATPLNRKKIADGRVRALLLRQVGELLQGGADAGADRVGLGAAAGRLFQRRDARRALSRDERDGRGAGARPRRYDAVAIGRHPRLPEPRRPGKFGAENPAERREIWRWILFDNHKLTSYTATLRFMRSIARTGETPVTDFLHKRASAAWGILDKHLSDKTFVVGERPTIADLSLCGLPVLRWRDRHRDEGLSGTSLAWLDRIKALPGWQHPYALMPAAPLPAAAS